jgi:SOS response regulatory protein OraA/RecX
MSSLKPEHSLAQAIRYARTGVRSRQEVQRFLERRGASASTIARILDICQARGVVDDRAYARLWAEHWARLGYARAAIHQRLAEKLVNATAIDHAINLVARDSDDEARARVVVARHLRRGRPSRSRLARALASRGFEPDVIDRVLSEAFDSPSAN